MNYLEAQRQKAVALRDKIFKDPGGGIFKQTEREYVLLEPALNIWGGVRDDAISYFNRYNIPFWDSGVEPTGHVLSSQIACINHLYFIRQRQDIATIILQEVDKDVKCALQMDNGVKDCGYVDFEVIGRKNYLKEKLHTRGANSTSVDAVMLAEMNNGLKKLFFIEWKYVEQYKSQPSKANGDSGKTRIETYRPLILAEDCPFEFKNIDGLFTEPYYQLMRQTLLANEMTKAEEYGASLYQHLHIIPEENSDLRKVNTANGKLPGTTLHETWTGLLKNPEKYKMVDPKDFIFPAKICNDTISWINYLEQRYWV
ncbi:MAG: hypothetical protein WCL06_00445 [Bacteroidota bacterium]